MEQLKFEFERVTLSGGDLLRVTKLLSEVRLTNEIGFQTKLPAEGTRIIVNACPIMIGVGHPDLKGIVHYRNGELLFYRENHMGVVCEHSVYLSRFWDGDVITITGLPDPAAQIQAA